MTRRGKGRVTVKKKSVRIAAVGDIHCRKGNREYLRGLFAHMARAADCILLCGDLVHSGMVEEAAMLADELSHEISIPIAGVLGNHDFELDRQDEIRRMLCDAGVSMLDGDIVELLGIRFAGIKGFGGGFGRYQLGAWGEPAIKHFVRESMDEALKLQSALVKMEGMPCVVLMHYAPIRATCEGEPLEVFPFLGSSHIEETINWFDVTAVFHAHAHNGSPEGRTQKGVTVYNVAMPLMHKLHPEHPPYRLVEIPRPGMQQEPTSRDFSRERGE